MNKGKHVKIRWRDFKLWGLCSRKHHFLFNICLLLWSGATNGAGNLASYFYRYECPLEETFSDLMLKSVKFRPKLDLTSFPWTSLPSSLLVSLLLQLFLSELLQWGVHPAPSSPLLCNNVQHVLCSGERTASHLSTSALSESAELFSELSVGFCHLLKSPGWYASALKLKNDTYSTAKQVKLQSQPLVALLDCVSLNTALLWPESFLVYNASAG